MSFIKMFFLFVVFGFGFYTTSLAPDPLLTSRLPAQSRGQLLPLNEPCSRASECSSHLCLVREDETQATCQAPGQFCVGSGEACFNSRECCSGDCSASGICEADGLRECLPIRSWYTRSEQCCSERGDGARCSAGGNACAPINASCVNSSECCTRHCSASGLCRP